MLMSNSGETVELLPYLMGHRTGRIEVVGRADSSFALDNDVVIKPRVDREVCPLNLAPTASKTVVMVIGVVLAALSMERRDISASDLALDYSAGMLRKS